MPSLYYVPCIWYLYNTSPTPPQPSMQPNTLAGMTMVGVIPALVNSNLRQQSLLHTITVAKARAVVFSSELTSGEQITPWNQPIELPIILHHTKSNLLNLHAHAYIDPGF